MDTTINNQSLQYLYDSGDKAHCEQDYETAKTYYKAVLKQSPQHYDALRWLADVYLEEYDYDTAIQYFEKAKEIQCDDASMLNDLGLCYYELYDYTTAAENFLLAVSHDGDMALTHGNIGKALHGIFEEDNNPQRAQNLAKKWMQDHPNNADAQFIGRAICGENVPQQSAEYVTQIFDDFAEDFDEKLSELNYKAPEILSALWQKHKGNFNNNTAVHILDVGCGTGLVAQHMQSEILQFENSQSENTQLRNIQKKHMQSGQVDSGQVQNYRFTGIDLSAEMLKIANQRNLYTMTECADVLEWLKNCNQKFDGIVAGDVLCYFGDLQAILQQFFTHITDDGLVLFSVEKSDKAEMFTLQPSGRYKHNPDIVKQCIESVGFKIIEIQYDTLRTEQGENVEGCVFALFRA